MKQTTSKNSWFVVALALVSAALFPTCSRDDSSAGAESDAAGDLSAPDGGADAIGDADTGSLEDESDVGPSAPTIAAELAEDLQLLLDEMLFDVRAPGATVAVRMPGYETWTGASGFADLAAHRSMSPEDRFRVGSITKTFVATTILQLEDEGVLSVDDAVDDWVPGFELEPGVTIRTLLTHTSGIFNFTDDAAFLGQALEPAEPEEVIAFALEHEQVFEPGTGYSYSNTNYFFAGLIIEAATGQPLHTVLRERLLAPLGLVDTYLEGAEEVSGPLAEGYVRNALLSHLGDPSWGWAAGAMISDADDVCTWLVHLLEEDVLPADVLERMLEPTSQSLAVGSGYGLGIRRHVRSGFDLAGHTGSATGYTTEVFLDLDNGFCVSVMTNDFMADQTVLAIAIWERLKEER